MPANSAPARATGVGLGSVLAALLFGAGLVQWLTLPEDAADSRMWLLAASSAGALTAAILLLWDSRWIRISLTVLAVMLVVGWVKALGAHTNNTHFAGAALGLLWMALVARLAVTPMRLMGAVLLFLVVSLFALAAGVAGIPTFFPPDVYAPVTGDPALLRRALAIAGAADVNQNALAALVLIVAPVGVSTLWFRARPVALRAATQSVGLVVSLGGVWILSVTRSDTAVMAVGGLLLLVLIRSERVWWRVAAAAAMMAMFAAPVIWLYRASRERAMEAIGSVHYTLLDRVDVLAFAWRLWREDFWLGVGLNEFRHIYAASTETVSGAAHAHNVFLQTGLDTGIIGLVAYCALLTLLLARANRVVREWSVLSGAVAAGAGASLVAVHLFGLNDAVALGAKIGLLQWMAAGLILAATQLQAEPVGGAAPAPMSVDDQIR